MTEVDKVANEVDNIAKKSSESKGEAKPAREFTDTEKKAMVGQIQSGTGLALGALEFRKGANPQTWENALRNLVEDKEPTNKDGNEHADWETRKAANARHSKDFMDTANKLSGAFVDYHRGDVGPNEVASQQVPTTKEIHNAKNQAKNNPNQK